MNYLEPEKALESAIALAATYHSGQVGKDGLPYILHPLWVMDKMRSLTGKTVAVMHDLAEDTEFSLQKMSLCGFDPDIVFFVQCLTREEDESYDKFIERCAEYDLPRQVKIWDIRHNLQLERLPEINEKDLARVKKYHSALKYLLSFGENTTNASPSKDN